ncbi:MAG: hypothetical protein QF464_18580, partial [Myxococcota bacterium]|nr:hypothetical protein [Myxococcota bacterium]
ELCPNTDPTVTQMCEVGQCETYGCDPDTWDVDGLSHNACEYECAIIGDGSSDATCNFTDDDCDGETDEDANCDPCAGLTDLCETVGETRCALDGSALVQSCTMGDQCAQWADSEYCAFDETFPNLCTGKADICVAGECVADGAYIVECPDSDPENSCEIQICDGATGECSLGLASLGTPCDDAEVCTTDDICFGSGCLGSPTDAQGAPVCPQNCLGATEPLECADYESFILGGALGTSLLQEYSCDGAVGYTGHEAAFLVSPPNWAFEMPLTLVVELADPGLQGAAFADIIVLETSPGYQCWANACVAVGYMDSSGIATVEIPAFSDADDDASNDTEYIVLVDGRDGFDGAVRLATWCVPGNTDIELYCTDGEDDDGNGLKDCADASCWDSLTCDFEHVCDDDVDDDMNGATDCDDDDCADDPVCQVESACDDGVDDEGDGLTDCDDDDCAFTPTCSATCEDA